MGITAVIAYLRLGRLVSKLTLGPLQQLFHRDYAIYLPEIQVHRADDEFMAELSDELPTYHEQKREYLAIIPAGLKIQ